MVKEKSEWSDNNALKDEESINFGVAGSLSWWERVVLQF